MLHIPDISCNKQIRGVLYIPDISCNKVDLLYELGLVVAVRILIDNVVIINLACNRILAEHIYIIVYICILVCADCAP